MVTTGDGRGPDGPRRRRGPRRQRPDDESLILAYVERDGGRDVEDAAPAPQLVP
jgi:hypothetical protein